jgi:CheY-like chemotaxis protein/MinD-like ATPase involved in chromosome partitioning or flagellar assembly
MTNDSSVLVDGLMDAVPMGAERQFSVLLIEDNEDQMLLVKYALEDCGRGQYRLEWVNLLSQGKERLAKGGIDVVLLDLGLPGYSGSSAYAAIRAAAPEVPVVVLTSDDREQTEVAVMTYGAEDFLIKEEISAPYLLRAIRGAIFRHKNRAPGNSATPRGEVGFSIGFVGTKGGVGVTSTVLNVAAVLGQERSTIVIETCMHRSGFAQQLRPDTRPAAIPYFEDKSSLPTIADLAVPTCLGARVLYSPLDRCIGASAAAAQTKEILRDAARNADFVLVDAGSQWDAVAQATLAECQAVVLVIDREPASFASVRDWSARLMGSSAASDGLEGGSRRELFVLLVDRSGLGNSSYLEKMQGSFAHPILGIIPCASDRTIWALERQRPLAYLDSGDAVSIAVREISDRLAVQSAGWSEPASAASA